jgi:putative hydrolases of HD superfamily
MDNERLRQQLDFIVEIDKAKNIFRQTYLMDGKRFENDAEHSWHLGIMAFLLLEHAAEPGLDVFRVVKMVLAHDLVEIDAGDTYCYDEEAGKDKAARELAAAERIFGLLPPDQGAELRALWDEFEATETPESRYAGALDRLQPLLHNYLTDGRAWRAHGISRAQVIARCHPIATGAPALWKYAEELIDSAVDKGYLLP